jgi:hypothetical protein
MLTRRTTFKLLSGAALTAALPLPAFAHRQKTTLSQVEWNEADKVLYVTHSYHMHDAETALAAAGIIDKPDLTSLRARAKLAVYTARNFQLSSGGKDISLDVLGAENVGRTVYVYQEAHLDEAPSKLMVLATMLREIIPDQLNNVDVTLTGDLTSVQFKNNDGPKKVL